jgi:hypothetical protein
VPTELSLEPRSSTIVHLPFEIGVNVSKASTVGPVERLVWCKYPSSNEVMFHLQMRL